MAHTTCRVELPAACVSRGIWGRTPDSNGWNDVGSTPTPPFFSFPCGTFKVPQWDFLFFAYAGIFPFRSFPLRIRVNKFHIWYYVFNERRRQHAS